MNIRKGLFRLWLVASIVWLVAATSSVIGAWPVYADPDDENIRFSYVLSLDCRFDDLACQRANVADENFGNMLDRALLVGYVVGPPLGGLLLYAAVLWIIAGFSAPTSWPRRPRVP